MQIHIVQVLRGYVDSRRERIIVNHCDANLGGATSYVRYYGVHKYFTLCIFVNESILHHVVEARR